MDRHRPALRIVLAITLALTLTATGCRTGRMASQAPTPKAKPVGPYLSVAESDQPPVTGGQLVYGLPYETETWKPTKGMWTSYSMLVARALYDNLFSYDENGTAVPDLLASAEPSNAHTQWTLKLRPSLRLHNGTPITARVVQRNLEQSLSEGIAGPSMTAAFGKPTFIIVNDLTLKVSFPQPLYTLPDVLATQVGMIADPDWLATGDDALPVGSGPFVLQRWDRDHQLVVRRNPDYWRKDRWGTSLPYLDGIEFRVIPDDQQRTAALLSGTVDATLQINPGVNLAELRQEAAKHRFQFMTDDARETPEDFIMLNTSRAPFNDPEARRALAHAIDQQEYVRVATGGLAQPATGIYSPSSPWFSDDGRYPAYDPRAARALVDKVKQRNGGRFSTTVSVPNTPEIERVVRFLQEELAAVGIEVQMRTIETAELIRKAYAGDYDAMLYQLFDFVSPLMENGFLIPPSLTAGANGTLNFSRISDTELLSAMLRINAARDQAAMKTAVAQRDARINELVPFIWLAHSLRSVAARPEVMNLINATLPNDARALDFVQGTHTLHQVWLRPTVSDGQPAS